jgi:hypothetical protein
MVIRGRLPRRQCLFYLCWTTTKTRGFLSDPVPLNLTGLEQDDPRLINYIRTHYMTSPFGKSHNLLGKSKVDGDSDGVMRKSSTNPHQFVLNFFKNEVRVQPTVPQQLRLPTLDNINIILTNEMIYHFLSCYHNRPTVSSSKPELMTGRSFLIHFGLKILDGQESL